MFENQIATLTTILKDKDIHNYMGDTFWNIIKAVSLGDIGALLDSSIDIKNMLFHAPSVLFWDKMQRYMFGTFRNYAEQVKKSGKCNEKNTDYEKFLKSSEEFIFAENKPEKSDIIFVPGNGYPQMAEKAAELFKKGMADWILPSGKYSVVNGKFSGVLEKSNVYDKEYGTEWEFLRDVLIKNGVPNQKILREDQATFTYENAIYSRQVTDHAELEIERAILCCKSYHARRCLMYYQLLYPETEFYVVPVNADGITRENWRKNEEGIDAVTGELSRIVKQFSLMLER